MSAEQRLASLGLTLPASPAPLDGSAVTGTLGADLSVAEGYAAARLCGLNLLANMRGALGSLDRVETVLKVLGMVRGVPDFGEQPEVINGCTDLFVEVFGDNGRPARSAVGMGSLPRGICVEIEAVVLIR